MDADVVPNDDHRGMARRAGYQVFWWSLEPSDDPEGWWIKYTGPDPARRALRDIGPYSNESDAWSRAIGLAMTYRDDV